MVAVIVQNGEDANHGLRERGSNHGLGDRLPGGEGVVDVQPDGGYG